MKSNHNLAVMAGRRAVLVSRREVIGIFSGITTFGLTLLNAASTRAANSRKLINSQFPGSESISIEPLNLPSGIRDRYVENINGLKIHLLEAGHEDSGRPVVLLLHGTPDLAYCWRKVMLPLAAAGYHVIAPDLRGFGRTTGWDNRYEGDVASFTTHNYARDAIGLAMALGHHEIQCVAGHDFGAAVAAYCALTRPDYFRSVAMMSYPFDGPPVLPFNNTNPPPASQSLAQQLAALPEPRKDSMAYFSTAHANQDILNCKQGLKDFFRAYFFVKSADWKGNSPYVLTSSSAAELAKIPKYYIMDLHETMPETVAQYMPSAQEIGLETWLPNSELMVYADEFERTGFQGAFNWFRCNTNGLNTAQLGLFSGRKIDIPSCFISGKSDWGAFRKPGALMAMREKAFTNMDDIKFIDGAGHWLQQEKPTETAEILIAFIRKQRFKPEK
jgi:pimeloyl-ACP methyl ester carboxylesterase